MKLTLGQFQDAFVEALYQRQAPALDALTQQPAFAVYRNTVLSGCVEALCANFPSVERLVGRAWMEQAATAYAFQAPPEDPRLLHYGEGFAAFLEAEQARHGLPYLADVARMDWHWTGAFAAPTEPSLALAGLAGVTAADLAHARLPPRASVRWQWFSEHPVFSLWRHTREALPWPQEHPWRAEGALLIGNPDGVSYQALEQGGCVFLDACAHGHGLEHASALALHAQPGLDFSDMLCRLLQAQVFRPLAFI